MPGLRINQFVLLRYWSFRLFLFR